MTALTAKDCRRAARAARELASEYAEGHGPALLAFSWCGCAAAEVLKRAGLSGDGDGIGLHMMAYGLDLMLSRPFTLSKATELQFIDHVPGALVVPLLWAADELDLAAIAAPKDLP